MKPLIALIALLILPTVAAQAPGQAQAFVSLPHAVDIKHGANDVSMRVVAQLTCEDGKEAPDPLQVVLLDGAEGPDDGSGPAWSFAETTWNVTWKPDGSNYTIDETITVQVEGQGYGDRGAAAEFTVGTSAVRNASSSVCTATGYTIPARTGHAHIQAGPRPVESKDAPGLALPLLAVIFVVLVGWRKT